MAKLSLHHATVFSWRRLPPHDVREVARITGLPSHLLRPDLFDPPAYATKQAAT